MQILLSITVLSGLTIVSSYGFRFLAWNTTFFQNFSNLDSRLLFLLFGLLIALASLYYFFEFVEAPSKAKPHTKDILLVDDKISQVNFKEKKTISPHPHVNTSIDNSVNTNPIVTEANLEVTTKESLTHENPFINSEIEVPTISFDASSTYFSLSEIDKLPQFKNGDFAEYIHNNFSYPRVLTEQDKHLTGLIEFSFIIEKNGQISQIHLLNGIHPLIDKQLEQILKRSPIWTPGSIATLPVRVRFIQKIRL